MVPRLSSRIPLFLSACSCHTEAQPGLCLPCLDKEEAVVCSSDQFCLPVLGQRSRVGPTAHSSSSL